MRHHFAALSLAAVAVPGADRRRAAYTCAARRRARQDAGCPEFLQVAESEWTDAQRALVARFGVAGRADNDLATYLRHPVLAQNIMPFERYIANDSTLTPRHRELLILRTAWLCRADYVWAHHADSAKKAGMTGEELARIARGPGRPGVGSVRGDAASRRRRAACQRVRQRRHLERVDRAVQDSRGHGRGVHRGRIHDGVGHAEFNRRPDRGSLQGQVAVRHSRTTWPRCGATSG